MYMACRLTLRVGPLFKLGSMIGRDVSDTWAHRARNNVRRKLLRCIGFYVSLSMVVELELCVNLWKVQPQAQA